jgi:hypothetical protein
MFSDETGHLSSARMFFGLWSLIVVYAAWQNPNDAFWPVAGSVLVGLLAWAAGPRIARYFGPQLGAIAQSFKGKGSSSTPTFEYDDYRHR